MSSGRGRFHGESLSLLASLYCKSHTQLPSFVFSAPSLSRTNGLPYRKTHGPFDWRQTAAMCKFHFVMDLGMDIWNNNMIRKQL